VDVEQMLAALEEDRRHGAGYLARKALGLLAATPPADRDRMAHRLLNLRPAMPAIAAAVREALESGDAEAVLKSADGERRRLAQSAAQRLRGRTVATISNSSLVARTLLNARPPLTQVVVQGEDDEGTLLLAELHATGLAAVAVDIGALEAGIAVTGCDAHFDDGTFVNRRGTATLVSRMHPRPVLVLTERWKHVSGPAATRWPEPDLFELVAPADNVELLGLSR
jgi:translation initiation factor 2B subunit (eIF-2B alpha/beta/delta family)